MSNSADNGIPAQQNLQYSDDGESRAAERVESEAERGRR